MFEILVMDARRTRKTQKWVEECVAAGVCLCGCGEPAVRRGLSQNCYYEWSTERKAMSDKDAHAYDAKLKREGKLLNVQEIRKIRRRNSGKVFSTAAANLGAIQ